MGIGHLPRIAAVGEFRPIRERLFVSYPAEHFEGERQPTLKYQSAYCISSHRVPYANRSDLCITLWSCSAKFMKAKIGARNVVEFTYLHAWGEGEESSLRPFLVFAQTVTDTLSMFAMVARYLAALGRVASERV